MKRIAVFASGSGSNAENFINYFRQNDAADISLVLSDNKSAKVLQRAEKHGVPHAVFTKEELACGKVLEKLKRNKIDFGRIPAAGPGGHNKFVSGPHRQHTPRTSALIRRKRYVWYERP